MTQAMLIAGGVEGWLVKHLVEMGLGWLFKHYVLMGMNFQIWMVLALAVILVAVLIAWWND